MQVTTPGRTIIQTVGDFLDSRRHLSRAVFVTRFPAPVLVHRMSEERGTSGKRRWTSRDDDRAITEELTRPVEIIPVGDDGEGNTPDLLGVISIRQRSVQRHGMLITVGRASSNDVVVATRSVSKVHAFFQPTGAGRGYQLTDAGSSNGTFVTGAQLAPQRPRALRNGDDIAFGDFNALFLEPQGFYEYLGRCEGD